MKVTRSVDVPEDVHRRLTVAKARLGARTIGDVIRRALDVLEVTMTAVCGPPNPSSQGKGDPTW